MILDDITEKKKLRLEEEKYIFDILDIAEKIKKDKTASFYSAMAKDGLSIIGEIKRASPSRGMIREDFEPVEIAREYEKAVDAVSVLTEEDYFKGKTQYLKDVHKEIDLPILRKDFIISPMQIVEAREAGASAVLLITAILKDKRVLNEYIRFAKGLGLDALVETHNEEELEIALAAEAEIIGINNRNLYDFTEDINTTVRLSKIVPKNKIVISESSIHTQEDIIKLKDTGINGILVGESFMKTDDIKKKADLFRGAYES
ncbi:MAG: indole-3-glycerol phosphate synthase TrpC [Firmicutes bacterium]|nr:indole-3-glycerol phosphate synthase TrpC [Bacillota bacterium]